MVAAAVLFGAGSCLGYTAWALFQKKAVAALGAGEAAVYIATVAALIQVMVVVVLGGGGPLRPTDVPVAHFKLVIGAAVGGAAGNLLFCRALGYPGVTAAVAVSGLYPALVAIYESQVMDTPLKTNQLVGVVLAVGAGVSFSVG